MATDSPEFILPYSVIGMQRPLQLPARCKRAELWLYLAADSGVNYMVLILDACKDGYKSCGVRFHPDFRKKAWEARQCAQEHEAVRIKLKSAVESLESWRSQEHGTFEESCKK